MDTTAPEQGITELPEHEWMVLEPLPELVPAPVPELREVIDLTEDDEEQLIRKDISVPNPTDVLVEGTGGGGAMRRHPSSSTRGRHQKRVSRFIFTLNNYTQQELEEVKTIDCKWMVVGKETGGATHTPHLQGAVVLHKQMALSRIKTLPGLSRSWHEDMQGSPEQSLAYCSKQDSEYFVKGTLPKPGKRNDLESTVEALRIGHSLVDLARENTSAIALLKYTRGIIYLRNIYTGRRDPNVPPMVFWFHGPTGTGKTRTAYEFGQCLTREGIFPYISSGSLRWFDGYDGQEVAIFDDLRAKDVNFAFLLRLLDRYPCTVEVKGGMSNWVPKYIFVTAPISARKMWSLRTAEQLDQLERRIAREVEFPISDTSYGELVKQLGIDAGWAERNRSNLVINTTVTRTVPTVDRVTGTGTGEGHLLSTPLPPVIRFTGDTYEGECPLCHNPENYCACEMWVDGISERGGDPVHCDGHTLHRQNATIHPGANSPGCDDTRHPDDTPGAEEGKGNPGQIEETSEEESTIDFGSLQDTDTPTPQPIFQ